MSGGLNDTYTHTYYRLTPHNPHHIAPRPLPAQAYEHTMSCLDFPEILKACAPAAAKIIEGRFKGVEEMEVRGRGEWGGEMGGKRLPTLPAST